MGIFKQIGNFLTGTPAKNEQVSTLMKSQQPLYDQLQAANAGKGAGGSFGEAADYYRDLLDPNSQTAQQMAAPQMRQFNEEIIPGLSEQFAGMGSGGLSSSGFRNAAVNAGTDLSERLGAMRAQLRQQGAAGLSNLGQQGLQSYSQNMETQPGSQGLLQQAAPAIGTALGSFAGPVGAAAGGAVGNWISNTWGGNNVGKNSSPYGAK
jgi:hypothetical protein